MIVRVSGEGQWRVPDDQHAALNDLDNQIVEALESCSQEEFTRLLHQLIDATVEARRAAPRGRAAAQRRDAPGARHDARGGP